MARSCHQKVWHSLAVEANPTPQPIAPGSEEEFITEHYWGYTKRTRAGAGIHSEYGVQSTHAGRSTPIPLRNFTVQAGLPAALYGPALRQPLNGTAHPRASCSPKAPPSPSPPERAPH